MRCSNLFLFLGGVVMLLAGCAAPGPIIGPDLSYTVTESVVVSKARLYEHSWDWLGEQFSGERRQVELADRKAGKIIATVRRDIPLAYQQERALRFRVQIDLGIERYRLTFDQPAVALEGTWYPIDGTRRDLLEPQVIGLYQELAADYEQYLSQFARVPLDKLY